MGGLVAQVRSLIEQLDKEGRGGHNGG